MSTFIRKNETLGLIKRISYQFLPTFFPPTAAAIKTSDIMNRIKKFKFGITADGRHCSHLTPQAEHTITIAIVRQ